MADLLQFWTDHSGPRLYGGIFHYPSALAEQLMADINPGINICHRIMWERVVNNTYGWLNARALFNSSQQAEFKRQQKCHAALNDLEKATEQLYDHSIEIEAQDNERRAKAEVANTRLPLERQLACKKKQNQAKVTGIVTPSTDDTRYQHWVPQPRRKTPDPDVPQLYATDR